MKIVILLFSGLFLISCGETWVVYNSDQDVYTATLENSPPNVVGNNNFWQNVSPAKVQNLGIGLEGKYTILATRLSRGPNLGNDGNIKIYNIGGAALLQEIDNDSLFRMIDRFDEKVYRGNWNPTPGLLIEDIKWRSVDTVIFEIGQDPVTMQGDLTPFRIDMLYDIPSKTVIDVKNFKTGERPIIPYPNHNAKSKYDYHVSNGSLIIEGNTISGLAPDIDSLDLTVMP